MIRLPFVFSDHALFQQNTTITLSGNTDAKAVTLVLAEEESQKELCRQTVTPDADGAFAVPFDTPAASFTPHTLTLTADGDVLVLSDILFGEVWFAGGQSNMEMPVRQQTGADAMIDSLRGKRIRAYDQDRIPGHTGEYSFVPVDTMTGHWTYPEHPDKMMHVSACGTAFADTVYDFLNRDGREVPIGILNCSVGGTGIESWLPRSVLTEYPAVAAWMKLCGKDNPAKWNAMGEGNYCQLSCHYNHKTYSLHGVKARGMLWYQGENNATAQQKHHIYPAMLRALRETYADLFSTDGRENFPCVSSQIYCWQYGVSGECHAGYLNAAFAELSAADPHNYAHLPINDLPPVWAFQNGNHPIHPAHKFALGVLMAKLVLNKYYGRKAGRYTQTEPATLVSCRGAGDKLLLKFHDVGSGLTLVGGTSRPRGLFIAGADGTYLPALCEIVNRTTLAVWNPGIKAPVHAAYAVSSLIPACGIRAGEFALTPFFTDLRYGSDCAPVVIEDKPWLSAANRNVWVFDTRGVPNLWNIFWHPVWNAGEGCEVCEDTTFSESGSSLHLCSADNSPRVLSAYVRSHSFNRLDFDRYSRLSFDVYHDSTVKSASLVLSITDKDSESAEVRLPAARTEVLPDGWGRRAVDFSALPEGEITRMTFEFELENTHYYFVNLDGMVLYPKCEKDSTEM